MKKILIAEIRYDVKLDEYVACLPEFGTYTFNKGTERAAFVYDRLGEYLKGDDRR